MKSNWPVPTEPASLSADEVHVWAVPLDLAATHSAAHLEILAADEQQRATEFRIDAPRQRFVISRAVLRILLGRYLNMRPADIRIATDANGKPRLAAEQNAFDIRFNLAHSDELALIAVTLACEIGVDLERLRAVHHADQIARRYFHPAEIAGILAAPPADRDAAFMRCWTSKEALLKAIGIGITGSLSSFQVPIAADQQRGAVIDVLTRAHGKAARCWLQRIDPGIGYAAAVALLGSERTIRCMTFQALT